MNHMIGTIPEFDSGRGDDWDVYHERLEQFFEVNEVPEVKRSAFLISVIGADAYKSLRDLCHPALPKDKRFAELCELLRKQFSPQIAVFRERTKFYNARHQNHENVTQWYGRVKRLSVDCRFGDHLETVLLDKFLTGLRPGQVLDRLCEENESLSLEQALDIAVNKECAAKESAYAPPKFEPAPYRGPFGGGCIPPSQPRVLFGGQPVTTCALPSNPQPFSGFVPPKPTGLFGTSGDFGGAASKPFGTFGSTGPTQTAFAAAPSSNLFGSSAAPPVAFSSPVVAECAPPMQLKAVARFATQKSEDLQEEPQELALECCDEAVAAPALGSALLEVDGVAPGANRAAGGGGAKGKRVRTRRRGRGGRGGAGGGDAAADDGASVDGEKELEHH